MLISTLTSKGQATIPSEVRKSLQLKAGDKVIFEIIDHKVILQKAQPFEQQYHHALSLTLSEWSSPEDNEAYDDL
jgi:AbrB family looped-hinge helix DNA binding protein